MSGSESKRNTVSISPIKVSFHTLTETAGSTHSYFGQTYNLLIFEVWARKIWKKLNKCAKILINHPNASIFWGCIDLRKNDNKLSDFSIIKF